MKHRLAPLCISILVTTALLTACAPAPGTERLSAGRTVDIASAATQISVQRAATGIVRPIIHSAALQAVAQAHADELALSESRGILGRVGSPLASRLQSAGYVACASAENVARGSSDIRGAISRWMGGEPSRGNLLNVQVTQFGIASASEDIWVLVMARPC